MVDPLRVLHITDSHLYAGREEVKNGLNPLTSLQEVLRSAVEQYTPDAIIHTGDLANEAVPETYELFLSTIAEVSDAPLTCTPGNHDLTRPWEELCPADDLLLGDWFITTIDSHIDHVVAGHIEEIAFEALREKLDQQSNFTLIGTHHPPNAIGVSWIDAHRTDNGDALLQLCHEYPVVKGLVCGHVHQEFEGFEDDLTLVTTPSTCWQFAEDSDSFQMSNKRPGWRWLNLHANGEITTQVGRLAN